MTTRLTQDEFISKADEIHNHSYDYSLTTYIGGDSKIEIICPKHGVFLQRAANHIRRKSGCPKCADENRNNNTRKTHLQALQELNERNKTYPPVYFNDGEEYTTAKKFIVWKCDLGHTWKAKFPDILRGHGCPQCAVRRREETNLEKNGYRYYTQRNLSKKQHSLLNDHCFLENQHFTEEKTLQEIAKELKVSPKLIKAQFIRHNLENIQFSRSQTEKNFTEFLESLDIREIIFNTKKIIHPYELDVYIPSHNLAIEINGIYWHSEIHGKRDKNYHLKKTQECKKKGIRLIHLFENEWNINEEIVKSRVKSVLKLNKTIYARKCSIGYVSSKDAKIFLDRTHLQGDKFCPIRIGLLYNDEIISVMTFAKPRYNKNYEYELVRYATKLDTNIVGGASKLFKYFVKQYLPKSIISYSDLRWNTGQLYKNLGFKLQHISEPNYYYFYITNPNILYSRVKFQKHKLSKILENFDPKMTEWQNMAENGYDRIWDCGNDVYVWYR